MATVSIQNDSRPGESDLWVNDHWTVTITGAAASSLVTVHAWQDGGDRGTRAQGYTDGSGSFVLVGTMGPESIGLWNEQWSVGGVVVTPTLQFRVRPLAVAASELPVEMSVGNWSWGYFNQELPTDLFITTDETVAAVPLRGGVGLVVIGDWAIPFNLCSGSVGRSPSGRKRTVYLY